jgi:hypothetical protein
MDHLIYIYMKKLICYLSHRKHWVRKRFLSYSDHNTIVNCEKCKCNFTIDLSNKLRMEIKKANRIKSLFETYFDGCYDVQPQHRGNSSTFSMGVCKLDFDIKTNTLTVHLRRPGLLIGKAGETIDNLKKWLECEVSIIEVKYF